MRARLHVRGPRIGFYREGTHELCDLRPTGQLLTATCDTLERLASSLHALGLDGVREIELAENVEASDRVVELDTTQPIPLGVLERIGSTAGLTGLVSPSGTHGSAHVTDRLTIGSAGTVSLRRHVRAFFQGNRYLLRDLVSHVVEQVPEKSEVLDLYAGAGLFAICAARMRGAAVTAVEGDRFAATDLRDNASRADLAVTTVHEAVERFAASSRRRPGCVIVDPPRTGMSREALDGVVALRAPRLVYVSCDVATLARDARRLVDTGYGMIRTDAFDLFPNTPHVETVVVFESSSR
jgi:23S rRNA (uracil1939-C5)-methyltransferase